MQVLMGVDAMLKSGLSARTGSIEVEVDVASANKTTATMRVYILANAFTCSNSRRMHLGVSAQVDENN